MGGGLSDLQVECSVSDLNGVCRLSDIVFFHALDTFPYLSKFGHYGIRHITGFLFFFIRRSQNLVQTDFALLRLVSTLGWPEDQYHSDI